MTHYFIDLRDAGGMIRDEEGADFASLEDALDEAKASARDLVKQYLANHAPLNDSCVEIRNGQGQVMAVLTVEEILDHPVHPAFKNNCGDEAAPGHR